MEAIGRRVLREPEDAAGVLVLAVTFVVMIASVFFRYVLNDSLVWAEEVARWGLIAITFLGTGTGVRRDSHIRIDLVERAGPVIGRVMRLFVLVVSLAVVGFLLVQAIRIMPVLGTSRSAALELPMSWLYAVVAAGLAGGVLRFLAALPAALRFQR